MVFSLMVCHFEFWPDWRNHVVVGINFLLRVALAVRFGRVLGAGFRDLMLFKDVGKLAMASAAVGLLCSLCVQ